ncbi:MAG: DedA family protein [Candidatus Kapabacteria bacterium]|nr:DedA family protein [Candidatus Kapabacteria bacterium]
MVEHLLEQSIQFLQSLPWWGVLVSCFFITYIENLFPPSPSDVLLVFIGTIVGLGTVGYGETVAVATAGSALGFITMFYIGRSVDSSVVESGRFRFLPMDTIKTAEKWFARWGYAIIIANRFLSGTRAIISFFAGMSNLQPTKTFLLSAVSALVWNAIIIFAGMKLGQNWRSVEQYMNTYSTVISILLGVVCVVFLIRYILRKRSANHSNNG